MISARTAATRALAGFVLYVHALSAAAAPRMDAEVTCEPAAEKFAHHCLITVKDRADGAPVNGLEITVGADMPSMAMAHNVKPVTAEPTGAPGEYKIHIQLEMHGEWALRLDVHSATHGRDRIIRKIMFGPPGRAHSSGN